MSIVTGQLLSLILKRISITRKLLADEFLLLLTCTTFCHVRRVVAHTIEVDLALDYS